MIPSAILSKPSLPIFQYSEKIKSYKENADELYQLGPLFNDAIMDYCSRPQNNLKSADCKKIQLEFLFAECYSKKKVSSVSYVADLYYQNETNRSSISRLEFLLLMSQSVKGLVYYILNYIGDHNDLQSLDYMRSKKLMQRILNMISRIDSNADKLFLMRNTHFFKDEVESINNNLLSSQISMNIDLNKFQSEDSISWLGYLEKTMLSEIEIFSNVMENYYKKNRRFCENEDLFDFFLFKFETKKENAFLIIDFLKRIYDESEIGSGFYDVISEIDSNIEWLYSNQAEDGKRYAMDYSNKQPGDCLEFMMDRVLKTVKRYRDEMNFFFSNKENYSDERIEFLKGKFEFFRLKFQYMNGNVLRIIDFFEKNIRAEYIEYTSSNEFRDSIDKMSLHINRSMDMMKFYFYNKKKVAGIDSISLLTDTIKIIPLKDCVYGFPEFLFREEINSILFKMEYFEDILKSDAYRRGYFYQQGFLEKYIEILKLIEDKLWYFSEKLKDNKGYIYKKYNNSYRYKKSVSNIVNIIKSRKDWLHTLQDKFAYNDKSIASD